MMPFKNLTESEYKELLKFPTIISLLAAKENHKLDDIEKASAIKLSHIKTYSCDPLLYGFYLASDEVFEKNIQQLDKELPLNSKDREVALKNELMKLDAIVLKPGENFVKAMHRSMKSFKKHVSQAHYSVLIDFVFPIPIKGLSY